MAVNNARRVFLNKKTIAGTVFSGLALAPVHAGENNEIKVEDSEPTEKKEQ